MGPASGAESASEASPAPGADSGSEAGSEADPASDAGARSETSGSVAVTTALAVYFWSGSVGLTLVIGVSMVLSMVAAGLAGAGIPLFLTAIRQDPAQSSSIILTTVTDVTGFFSFLGIATLLSEML